MAKVLNTQGGKLCRVENLCISLLAGDSEIPIVRDVSFQINRGDYFALVGESGSGKSVTCLSMLSLLSFPARISGSIEIDGGQVLDMTEGELRNMRRYSCGMIFQDPVSALNPVRTIGSQILETLRLYYPNESAASLRTRTIESLERVHFNQPEARLGAYPHQLSGGLNQRVMIALALIADEATTALDTSVQAEILNLIDELRSDIGLSVLMVTHDLGIVRDRATHIAVMRSGKIVEQGAAQTLLANSTHPYTLELFEASKINRSEVAEDTDTATHAPYLKFDKVCKEYKSYTRGSFRRRYESIIASDNVSFSINRGEIVALVGESGSGKTTLAKMAMGLVTPDSGTIEVAGDSSPMARAVSLQMIFQHPKDSLDQLMTIDAQFHEVLMVHGWNDKDKRNDRIQSVVEDVGLSPALLSRRSTYLSGGEAQRAVIARALLLSPNLLIADEPLSSVDVTLQKQILRCFSKLRDRLGIAILLITHDLRVVFEISDRVIVMRHGKVVEQVPVASFGDGRRDPYTQKLIDAIPGGLGVFDHEMPGSPSMMTPHYFEGKSD